MFTGIVQDQGTVIAARRSDRDMTIVIQSSVFDEMAVGDSVAVNGVCLTAVTVSPSQIEVNAVAETLSRTNLGDLDESSTVNLERPMSASSLFDGHIVQGHVDGMAEITQLETEGESVRIRLRTPPNLGRYLVEKGSVTLDGISLTVAALTDDGFEVAIIPHTLAVTNLGTREVGDRLNVEVDVLAKYVERLMS